MALDIHDLIRLVEADDRYPNQWKYDTIEETGIIRNALALETCPNRERWVARLEVCVAKIADSLLSLNVFQRELRMRVLKVHNCDALATHHGLSRAWDVVFNSFDVGRGLDVFGKNPALVSQQLYNCFSGTPEEDMSVVFKPATKEYMLDLAIVAKRAS